MPNWWCLIDCCGVWLTAYVLTVYVVNYGCQSAIYAESTEYKTTKCDRITSLTGQIL